MSKIELRKKDIGKFVQIGSEDSNHVGVISGVLIGVNNFWVTIFDLNSKKIIKPWKHQVVFVGKHVRWE